MTVAFQTTTEFRGLALPAKRGDAGYFGSKTRMDTAWGDLILAVMTPRGSRPCRRDFGSALHDLLFGVGAPDSATVSYVVEDAVSRHCPHLEVHRVEVASTAKHWEIGIMFGLRSDRGAVEGRRLQVP